MREIALNWYSLLGAANAAAGSSLIGLSTDIRLPVLGALLLSFLPEVLRGVDQYRLLAFGVAMVLMMRYRPVGIWPERRRYLGAEEDRGG